MSGELPQSLKVKLMRLLKTNQLINYLKGGQ